MESAKLLPSDNGKPKSHSLGRLPHLDGLRAIAITGVLLFHFEFSGVGGGFVGVDMFFTISGFLITRNIVRAVANNRFSLIQFYKRRFYRLYPASMTTIAVTLLVTFLFVPPFFTGAIFESAIASMSFWSNVFFHRQGGYFYDTYEMRPLLHFWSLSVEEQFYLFWPPLIILITTCTTNQRVLPIVLSVLSVISLTFATVINVNHSSWAFYELPSRVFQFAAGALLMLSMDKLGTHAYLEADDTSSNTYAATENVPSPNISAPPRRQQSLFDNDDPASDAHNLISVISLTVVVVSFMYMPESPSPLLVVPITLATCALIALPRVVFAQVLLASWPFEWFGKVSYSVYLAHWPIFVLGTNVMEAMGLPSNNVFLMLLSVVIGAALKYKIEDPLRFGGGTPAQRRTFFACTAATLAFAIAGVSTAGMKFRFPEAGLTGWPPGVTPIDSTKLCKDVRHEFSAMDDTVSVCRVGDWQHGRKSEFVIFGDSFTEHLMVALQAVGDREGVYFDMHFSVHCGFRSASEIGPTSVDGYNCQGTHDTLWSHLQEIPNSSTIIVANWWGTRNRLLDALRELRIGVEATGHEMVIFSEPPGVEEGHSGYYSCADMSVLPLGRLLSLLPGQSFRGAANCLDFSKGLMPEWMIGLEREVYIEAFQTVMKGVRWIDPFTDLCHVKQGYNNTMNQYAYLCRVPAYIEGVVYDIGYKHDLTHLSSVGSYHYADFIQKELYPSRP